MVGNYRFSTTDIADFRVVCGAKIPLNKANSLNSNGLPLPMEYQSSLGTYDLILGGSLVYNKKMEAAILFQTPVANKNENQYSPQIFNNNFYSQTTGFERRSDVVLKLGYIFTLNNSRFSFRPNLLSIFHLGKDTYTDALNNTIEIPKSDGVTINCILNTIFTFKDSSQLVFSLATPSPVRTTIRPDGLVRIFGANLQYNIKF